MTQKPLIAIVGIAGVFPGATDVDRFWQNIIQKVDTAEPVPADRWAVRPDTVVKNFPEPDKAFHSRACLIKDFHLNSDGIELDSDSIKALDPMHRLVLHTGRAALSGIKPHKDTGLIAREKTGVILAAIALPTESASGFARFVFEPAISNALNKNEHTLSASASSAPGRIISKAIGAKVTSFPAALLAKAFGLGGGTFTLDAACASSLYSIKLACDELQSHRAEMMLAGGVSRPDSLYTQIGFSQLRALSPSGRCAPFDQSADGLLVGEGCGILVLKRLSDAQRDGDNIWGVIRGFGLSNDIGGNLLAPNAEGQLRAMRAAYAMAGWSPSDVDLIECHGAGTPIGDAVELESLSRLRETIPGSRNPCAIGSVKSMIGHLLTAAGAAGLIKVLLSMQHGMLPPTLHYQHPVEKSPLENGPFYVPTEAQPWPHRAPGTPRRAAVSAFGFGGINAHLLVEEYSPDAFSGRTEAPSGSPKRNAPIAVVGMAASIGPLQQLREFQEAVFNGTPAFVQRPGHRWKGMDRFVFSEWRGLGEKGAFVSEVPIDISRFHIPPNELPDIIPQHLLMLNTAAEALLNAGLSLRADRTTMGAVIGMGFDMEATNFHLRWTAPVTGSDDPSHLKDGCAPPLTSARTLGALGSMVASRIAKEFRFGAPSFVVSCEEASGIKALEVAMRALQLREADAMLVGAVDMTGDLRHIVQTSAFRAFSEKGRVQSFDRQADGILPGEGAVALVVKRLDQAVAEGDRIYAVIDGIGGATGSTDSFLPQPNAFHRSLERCLADAGRSADDSRPHLDLVEMLGTGDPVEDRFELNALHSFLEGTTPASGPSLSAIGAVSPVIGHTGAVAGLASVVTSCLCLYQEILPPTGEFVCPAPEVADNDPVFFPAFPQYWARNRMEGPRSACTSTMTKDGNFAHVLLSGPPERVENKAGQLEKKRPLGYQPFGLFALYGDNENQLQSALNDFNTHFLSRASAETPLEALATQWHPISAPHSRKKLALALIADTKENLTRYVSQAIEAVRSNTNSVMTRWGGVAYTTSPMGNAGEVAFVFPGSGNHSIGLGRQIGAHFPEVLRAMDANTDQLKNQMLPHLYVPQRSCWRKGWETEAGDRLAENPLHMIFGQVMHGGVMSDLIRRFDIQPDAVIGYSLGETAGNFALGVWQDRGEMLKRMQHTDLFSTQLGGPCKAGHAAWKIPDSEPFDWYVAAVNQPADAVKTLLPRYPFARLLIVNTPEECVIGGRKPDVLALIQALACEAVFIEGVVTVHCDAVTPVAEAYRDLHLFPVTMVPNVRFYSCAQGRRYAPNTKRAAQSILDQALHGFDFTKTIQAAYENGVRVFLELGPHHSCSRMIQRILRDKAHVAVSACTRGEDEILSVLKCLATLITEHIPLNLSSLYGEHAFAPQSNFLRSENKRHVIVRPVGDEIRLPAVGPRKQAALNEMRTLQRPGNLSPEGSPAQPADIKNMATTNGKSAEPEQPAFFYDLATAMEQQAVATARAHETFLDLSNELTTSFAETYAYQMNLFEALISDTPRSQNGRLSANEMEPLQPKPLLLALQSDGPIAFSREMCLEFAVGSVEKVLGPLFAPVDTYRARVRLPNEPLMLVDRILSVEGEKGVLGTGKIVTEHDVLPGAWYLDGGRAPVCISVEAGQADLFLSAYMGIDLHVKGERTYRLLDAVVEFFRELPKPGETIRYDITIERFAGHGDTYLFFFHFDGVIGDELLIRMRNGCAGFFTAEEVKNSGGIIFTEPETQPRAGILPPDWAYPVPMAVESYDEAAVNALRNGNPAACFGAAFAGKTLPTSLRLPSGRMTLIDRILHMDPAGGRYGLGLIRAEADITPDKWFLTCHFVDDRVMPGTLMYECCAHTLRVFLQRMGWISDKETAHYAPVIGIQSRLKCRGPVTPETQKVIYEIEIKELGYGPEPYAIGDALMYADGQRIVWFQDMTLKLSGVSREEIDAFWAPESNPVQPIFDDADVAAFSAGNPSDAFGEPYRPFDSKRFIARLPRMPFSFISRITKAEPPPWELTPGGWITAEYDVPKTAWYFTANRTPTLPISILLEIALQPCGWLAAYAGSALKSDKDLRFRNLDGRAELLSDVSPAGHTLTTRSRLTKVAIAGDMIIEHFDFEVSHEGIVFYRGQTNFGFFTPAALAQQVGLGEIPALDGSAFSGNFQKKALPVLPPLRPDDRVTTAFPDKHSMEMPAKALLMIDRVLRYDPTGGASGLGYLQAQKSVDPSEWFFDAHFYQDPVCPGSLGIESFIQLLRFAALEKWPHLKHSHRVALQAPSTQEWTYRGQVTPRNNIVTVEAVITDITEGPRPSITARGYLKVDGLPIYKMDHFGIELLPVNAF
ncbi:MAG: beta-ketoacyl synthase N-terminal-like domain-containing protein [Desulfobacterales bacterium]|jgi:PfaB family protein|nr:beta-ketoacyl synthase N-terminal-like domain-containing protein [Desulfobacterales bacterium]